MRARDHLTLALHGVLSAKMSVMSNTVAVLVGLTFFGGLLSLSVGVGAFLERYYTRTMALTTLLAFQNPDAVDQRVFDPGYRNELRAMSGVKRILYHDIDFAELAISQDRTVTVSVRSAVENDPEIERLEFVAGDNLPSLVDPLNPSVVISLARAHRLSQLPPAELIGSEVAVTFSRGLRLEDEQQRESVYGTIVGIVNETPDESIYVHYPVLAAARAWQRATVTPPRGTMPAMLALSALAPVSAPLLAAFTAVDVSRLLMDEFGEAEQEVQRQFTYATVGDAWEGIKSEVERDAIVYPHMRIQTADVASLARLRGYFREQGIATSCVLDEITAIRELRNYAVLVFSAIGLITLVAAMCSIFNTLQASVERRTCEIGLLRALGASGPNVLAIFLLEGVVNALLGGGMAAGAVYIGARLGNDWIIGRMMTAQEAAHLADMNPALFAFPWWLPLSIVLLGVVTSLLAAVLPAVKACLVQPAEALRHS